ncbi:hypothetical protein Tco_0446681 [Tanacetum coccineum]
MFSDEVAHHNSSPPANTTSYPITTPQHNSLQENAKRLMQKAKKNMRKINFKKAVAQKFKEYDQKLEALTSINVSEVIEKVVQEKVLTKMKKLLPTHVPIMSSQDSTTWCARKKRRKDVADASSRLSRKDKSYVVHAPEDTPWSANAKRRTKCFDLLLKSKIDKNEGHILRPSTTAIAKKLKELIQKDKLTIADLKGVGIREAEATIQERYGVKSCKSCHEKEWGYGFLSSIMVRRLDKQEYTFSYTDLPRFNLNDIEDMYLLKVQDKMHHLPSEDEKDFNNALLLFNQRTIQENLIDMVNKNKLGHGNPRLKGRDWNDKDIKRSKEMLDKIDQVRKHCEQLRRLEEYVGGRPKTIDPCFYVRPM